MRGHPGVAGLGLAAALVVAGIAQPAYATAVDDPRCADNRVLDVAGVVDFATLKQLRSTVRELPRRVSVKVLTYDGLAEGQDLEAALQDAAAACEVWGYEPGDRRSLLVLGVDADSASVASVVDGRLADRFVETEAAAEEPAAALLEGGDVPQALTVLLGTYAAVARPGGDGLEAPAAPEAPSGAEDASPTSRAQPEADPADPATGEDGAVGETDDGDGGGTLLLLLALLLAAAALGLLGAHRLRRRRLGRQLEVARSSADGLAGQAARLGEDAALLVRRTDGLPDNDDPAVVDARARSAQADAAAQAARVAAHRAAAEHTAVTTATATAAPSAGQVAAAATAYAAARVEVADAAAQVAAAGEHIDDLVGTIDAQPDRVDAVDGEVAALALLLGDLRTRGYRTDEYDHVPPALGERLEEARRLQAERRPAAVGEMLSAIEHDVAETRHRLERLDQERADLAVEIEALGERTPALDAAMDAAHRDLARLSAAVAPVTVEEPRAQLEQAGEARAALPRLLRAASDECSVERQQLVHARRHLTEGVELFERAERVVAEVRVRLDELAQVAQELPISADRTAARAQRLAERSLRQAAALGEESVDAHALGDQARALGDEARAERPDLVDIAVRLDALRHEVADAERRLDDVVEAHAARRLAVSAARAAVEEASTAASTEEAAALVREATALLDQAEAASDHVRARELAEAAAQTARRVGGSA